MGDWDRHRKQWRWAKLPGNPLWVPIPEDRDQAFSRYEGWLLDSGARPRSPLPEVRAEVPEHRRAHLQRLGAGPPPPRRLHARGLRRARRRSCRASSPTPPSRRPCGRMPPEWYAVDGPRLVAELKARRDALPGHRGEVPPSTSARGVDVYLTNQSERVEAKRLGNGDMDVTVRMAGDGRRGRRADLPSRVRRQARRRRCASTALGGNDTVVVTGGGNGPARAPDRRARATTPSTPRGAGNAKLSDTEGQNRAVDAERRRPRRTPAPAAEERALDPAARLDARELGRALGLLRRRPRGVPRLRHLHRRSYGFRKTPYLDGAPGAGGLVVRPGERPRRLRRRVPPREPPLVLRALRLRVRRRGAALLRVRQRDHRPPRTRTSTRSTRTSSSSIRRSRSRFGRKGLLTIGPALKYTQSDESEDQFINTVKPYGVGEFGELALHGVAVLGRPRQHASSRGRACSRRRAASYFPQTWDVDQRLRPGERQPERAISPRAAS